MENGNVKPCADSVTQKNAELCVHGSATEKGSVKPCADSSATMCVHCSATEKGDVRLCANAAAMMFYVHHSATGMGTVKPCVGNSSTENAKLCFRHSVTEKGNVNPCIGGLTQGERTHLSPAVFHRVKVAVKPCVGALSKDGQSPSPEDSCPRRFEFGCWWFGAGDLG